MAFHPDPEKGKQLPGSERKGLVYKLLKVLKDTHTHWHARSNK